MTDINTFSLLKNCALCGKLFDRAYPNSMEHPDKAKLLPCLCTEDEAFQKKMWARSGS